MMFEEMISFVQVNTKPLLFIIAFGCLAIAVARAWLCDILGFDVLTGRKIKGDDLFPVYLGEPNIDSEEEKRSFLLKDKRIKLVIIYPAIGIVSVIFIILAIFNIEMAG